MPRLNACLSSFLLKVQFLTPGKLLLILISLYGAPRELPELLAYIPLVGFSKPTWILATFLTYSFYSLSHHIEIHWLTTHFIRTSSQDNNSMSNRSSSMPLLPIEIFPSVMVNFLSNFSSQDCWSTLSLRLLLHKGLGLLISCWMKSLELNITFMCMVPWALRFPIAPKMLHRLSRLLRRHLLRNMRFEPWSKMHPYQRLLQVISPVDVVLDHLEFLMEHRLLHTRFLRIWIPCLYYFVDPCLEWSELLSSFNSSWCLDI